MDAGKRTISDIFNGNRKLIIPFFQRTYVWKEEQWARLIEDMEYISASGKDYFLGSIILKSTPTPSDNQIGDVRTVIDGQQRLTTMSIFMKVLGIKSHNEITVERLFTLYNGSLALQHSQGDADAYNRIMSLKTLDEIEAGNSNIIKAYNYFKENADEKKLNLQMICNKAQFVGIDLLSGEDEQQIFDTINSLGVRLTTGELLKNYFFSKDSIKEYEKYWRPVFEADDDCRDFWDQDVTAGRLRRNNIETFLSAYLQIKIQDPNLCVRTEDKMLFRRSEGLFNNYKRFINDYIITEDLTKEEKTKRWLGLIEDLTNYAKIYKNNFSVNNLSTGVGSTPSIERMNIIIYGLEGSTTIPYLMFVLKNVLDEDEKEKIFGCLESYLMRRLVCKSHNNNYSDLFTENLIGNNIRTAEDLVEYIEDKDEDAALAMPSNLMVRKAFHDNILPNKRAAGVLYMLESRIRSEKYHSTSMLGFNTYSVEHLMPKKWRNNWGAAPNEEYRDFKLLTLGNLAIITATLNASIRDAEWPKKLAGSGYKGGLKSYSSGLETMEKVLSSPVWNEKMMSERADWLADKAIEIWPSFRFEEEEFESESDIPVRFSTEKMNKKKHLDQTMFSLDGSEFMKKGQFVLEVVRKYMVKHPDITFNDLRKVFPDTLLEKGYEFIGLLCTVDEWNAWQNDYKERRYRTTLPDTVLTSSDGIRFYVNGQWSIKYIKGIVDIAEREGFVVNSKV